MPNAFSPMLRRAPVLAISAAVALCAAPALADRPLAVDEVETSEAGSAKLELGWNKDGKTRGWELSAGFVPIANVELEVGLGRARDHGTSPAAVQGGAGVSAKWVPLQPQVGLSAGVKAEYGRARFDDRLNPREHARVSGFSALAGWRFESELAVHASVGREWVRASGDTDAANTWGVAFVQPVSESLEVIAEFFGAEKVRPDRQVGLRYEIVEGVKVSGAVGRGSDRSIGNVGISWEF